MIIILIIITTITTTTTGMLDLVLPKHQLIEAGPMTLREEHFHRHYGLELQDAHKQLKAYITLMHKLGKPNPTSDVPPTHKSSQKSRSSLPPEEQVSVL